MVKFQFSFLPAGKVKLTRRNVICFVYGGWEEANGTRF